jgi:glycine/D-amino acid oxidase-like deaminating enzyme
MTRPSQHIVVVGAGITGAFAAYFLARGGASVTLLERDGVATHASGHNPGGLNPLHGPGIPGPLRRLALESFRLHLEHWEEVEQLSGLSFGGRRVARLHVALDEDDARALPALAELHEETPGFSGRLLGRSELLAVEPRVTPDAVGGLLAGGNACVEPAAYTRAVVRAAERRGACLCRGEAAGLRRDGARAAAVAVAGAAEIPCDGVVVAPGAWAARSSDWLGVALPVTPVKGELLLVEAEDGLEADVSRRHVGAYEAEGGRIWLGGTEDDAAFDSAPSDSGRERILAGIAELLPGLGSPRILRHVASLRPSTPDGLPLVGAVPGLENVYFAGGGGRKGMLLGAGLGRAAADLLALGATRLSVDELALERFGVAA